MLNKNKLVSSLIALTIFSLGVFSIFNYAYHARAATLVNLLTAGNFAVLAGSGITNAGTTLINGGDVGSSPTSTETGFGSVTITNGINHTTADPNDAATQQAKLDLVTAYGDAGQTPTTIATELGGTSKLPGTYNSASGTFGITGTLTLDGNGNTSSIFIFQTATTVISAASSNIALTNGAQACNVFWQVGSSATFGTGSQLVGNFLAVESITDSGGSTIYGRLLADADNNGVGAVNLNSSTVTRCAPKPVSAVIQNSTATTVDIVVTGINFDTFVSLGTATANATDLSKISYNGIAPTSATINNATTITATFPISMGTGKSGGPLTFQAGTVKDAISDQNIFATVADVDIIDSAKPVILTRTYQDMNADGSVDRVSIHFSENVTWNGNVSALNQFAIVANDLTNFGTGSIGGQSGIGTDTFTLSSFGNTTNLTGVGGGTEPTLQYTKNGTGADHVKDNSGNELDSEVSPSSISDGAAPIVVSATTGDSDGNGQIDTLTVVYSEAVNDSDYNAVSVSGYSPDDASFDYSSATYCQSGAPATPTVTGVPGGTFSATPAGLSLNPTTGTINLATSALGQYTISYNTNGSLPNTSSITMTIANTTSSAAFSYSSSSFSQNDINPAPIFSPGGSAGTFSAPVGLIFKNKNSGKIDLAASQPGTYLVTHIIPASGSCSGASDTFTVTITGSTVTSLNYPLIESGAPDTGDTPALTWTSANATDLAGNILDLTVAPANAIDGAKPVFISAITINTGRIDITLSELIVVNIDPSADFTIGGVVSNPTVTSVSASGSVLILQLSDAMTDADTPTVDYNQSTGIIDDLASTPNSLVNFIAQSVTNTLDTTDPTGTVTLGTPILSESDLVQEVTVTYDEAMDPSSTPIITYGATTGTITSNVDGSWTSVTTWYETFTITDANEETVGLTVNSSGATDAASHAEGPDVQGTFDIDTLAPSTTIATPPAGSYTSTQNVTLTSAGSDSIRYTTNGSTPTCSTGTLYSGAISVSLSTTIKALGCDNAGNASLVALFAYTITTSGGGGGGGGGSSIPSDSVSLSGTSSINGGADATITREVTIWLTYSAAATEVIISEDPNFVGASYQPVKNSIPFVLSVGYGIKTVYIRLRSSDGVSLLLSDTIEYKAVATPEQLAPKLPTPPIEQRVTYNPTTQIALATSINADKGFVLPPGVVPHCLSGTLIKLPDDHNPLTQMDSTVYYCGADGKRHVFPNAATYFSWYTNFSGIQVVSKEIMASIPLGLNVTSRPGVRMIKFGTDPKVYAVAKNGRLLWIVDATVAQALYGVEWKRLINDISDAFYTDYTFDTPITLADVDLVL